LDAKTARHYLLARQAVCLDRGISARVQIESVLDEIGDAIAIRVLLCEGLKIADGIRKIVLTPFGKGVPGELVRGAAGRTCDRGSSVVRVPLVRTVLVFPPIGQAIAVRIGGRSRQHQVDPMSCGTVGLSGREVVGSGGNQ